MPSGTWLLLAKRIGIPGIFKPYVTPLANLTWQNPCIQGHMLRYQWLITYPLRTEADIEVGRSGRLKAGVPTIGAVASPSDGGLINETILRAGCI